MNLIIVENKNANVPAIKKVEAFLPQIQKQTRAFDSGNSATTLSMMSLTMLTGQMPMRMLRQIAAETEKRTSALNEAQFNLAKKQEVVEELIAKKDKTLVEEAELRMEQTNGESMLNKMNGSIKDIAVLAEAYDNIKKKHNIDEWDEVSFEAEEKLFHIRRGFEMLYKNLLQQGRPQEATMEYMQQYGILPQVAIHICNSFIKQMEEIIQKGLETGQLPHANALEDWLDGVAKDFVGSADITSERMFGKKDFTNKDYMMKMEK